MHKSLAKLPLLSLASAATLAALAQDRTIELETRSFSLDRKSNVTTYDGLRIDAGEWSLIADRASAQSEALDFESGEWRFEGNVRVVVDTASIVAQSAIFSFTDKELVRGELWGTPVTFEEASPEDDGPVIGEAEQLVFDNQGGTIQLLGRVALTVGPYQTTGCDLVYFLDTERFTTGSSECQEPFRTVITPTQEEPSSESEQ